MDRKRRNRTGIRNPFGFTLVETVIAIALFSVVAISAYGSFRSGFLAYQRIESGLGKEHEFNMLTGELTRELRNTIEYARVSFEGKSDSIRFPCRLWRYEDGRFQEDLYDVSYRFRGRQLERTEEKLKKSFPSRETVKESLMSFESFRFQYAYRKQSGEIEWKNEWSKTPYLGLPRAIRFLAKGRSSKTVKGGETRTVQIFIPHGVLGRVL